MRRLFENVNQRARKDGKAYYCARPTKPAVSRKVFYASLRSDQGDVDHVFMLHGKRSDHAYHDRQKQLMLPSRTPVLIGDYRRDRPG